MKWWNEKESIARLKQGVGARIHNIFSCECDVSRCIKLSLHFPMSKENQRKWNMIFCWVERVYLRRKIVWYTNTISFCCVVFDRSVVRLYVRGWFVCLFACLAACLLDLEALDIYLLFHLCWICHIIVCELIIQTLCNCVCALCAHHSPTECSITSTCLIFSFHPRRSVSISFRLIVLLPILLLWIRRITGGESSDTWLLLWITVMISFRWFSLRVCIWDSHIV